MQIEFINDARDDAAFVQEMLAKALARDMLQLLRLSTRGEFDR